MAWFWNKKGRGAGSSRRRRKAKERGRRVSLAGFDRARTLLVLRVLAAVALFGGMVVAWVMIKAPLEQYASVRAPARPGVPADRLEVVLADAPVWLVKSNVPGGVYRPLQMLVAQHITGDPLAVNDLESARVALENCAWVRRVHRLERKAGNRIEVYAEYREPIAAIKAGGDEYYLVDREGVRLLSRPYSRKELPAQCMIVDWGDDAPPHPAPAVGSPWGAAEVAEEGGRRMAEAVAEGEPINVRTCAADVAAGLALVELLRGRVYEDELAAIDVSRRDTRGRLKLFIVTTNNARIEWGLPPGEERAIEVSTARKLVHLDTLHERADGGPLGESGMLVQINRDAIFLVRTARQSGSI